MRLFLFCLSSVIGIAILPLARTNAQVAAVFEGQDASIETLVLSAPISPIESAFVSFGNANGRIQSLHTQPAISPRENNLVSWGNADATVHSIPRDPFSLPPVNFEELLAEKYKPILYFHEEERFRPQEIQVVLDTAVLYKNDTFIAGAPPPLTPDLLASSTDSDFKLDLLGDVFLDKSPVTNETYKNTAYVHVTQDQGHVVLQYWFFYYFNNWEGGPDHEGDWEFIQLIFPANKSPQEIIEENISPDEAVYSAHLGGYREDWENDAVEKDGDRPVVYVAKGSHANYFQKGTCDLTTPRGTGVDEMRPQTDSFEPINSRPITDPVNGTEFKWFRFGGTWGDSSTNSPKSPLYQAIPFTEKNKWLTPLAWIEADIGGFPIIANWNRFYFDHCDGDFDGIWNNVDEDPSNFSNDFEAPGPFGRKTKGTITKRGDREFKIKDAEVGGAHITANFGTQLATIKFDALKCISVGPLPVIGPFLFIPSLIPFAGTVTCGSIEVSTEEGTAELQITVGSLEVKGTVNAGQTIKYDVLDDKLHIETSGEGEILLVINGETITIQAGETFSVHEVQIDIKPGSDTNPVNCKDPNIVIPVTILTTEDFDATTVDHTTVLFEGASEMHEKRHEEDVDDDGDIDLMFHFLLGDTTLTCESTQATLTGRTFSGDLFIGTDSIDMKIK